MNTNIEKHADEIVTSADELAYVRGILGDTSAVVELNWMDNDTTYDFEVYVHRGDWKHDHLRIKHIMEAHGYKIAYEEITEEDGSDCYSALYYFG